MEEIRILLDSTITLEQRTIAANAIITNYDLHFSVDNIIKACNNSMQRNTRYSLIAWCLALTTNLRLFIAMVYALIDNNGMTRHWYIYLFSRIVNEEIGVLGCNWVSSDRSFNIALNIWSRSNLDKV